MTYRSAEPRKSISPPPSGLTMYEAYIPLGLGPRKRCTVVARLDYDARRIAARRMGVEPTYKHLHLRRLPRYD